MIFNMFISKRNKERMVAMGVFELLRQELDLESRLSVPVPIKCRVCERTVDNGITWTYFKVEEITSKQLLLGALVGDRYLGKLLTKRFDIDIGFRDIPRRTDTVICINDKCSGCCRNIYLPDYRWVFEDDVLIDSYFDIPDLDELKNKVRTDKEEKYYSNSNSPITMVVGCPNIE